MKKEIIISYTTNQTRIAITEDGELAEFLVDLPSKERYIGNIFLGKVNKIVPALNAAFINIGMNQDAFLHFSDLDDNEELSFLTEEDEEEFQKEKNQNTNSIKLNQKNKKNKNNTHLFKTKKSGNIEINLKEGQYLLVQVIREAYAKKGLKVTNRVAVPGRYLVFLPFEKIVGVSKKISSYNERKRLRNIVKNYIIDGTGCIIRTASNGKSEEELKKDYIELIQLWSEIEKKYKNEKVPGLVYQDLQLTNSVIRDLFTSSVHRVITDSKKLYKEIINYLKKVSPHLESKVELFDGNRPIFEEYGIDKELNKTNRKRVSLPSGGDIVIEHTEAMTIIDVNSGKSNEKEQEASALNTNLEAVKEISKQIRLRDLGGMILIDFIDMLDESNKKKIYNEMKKYLKNDRAKTVIYPLTQLGIMQITRQRINQNILEKVTEICHTCKGTGRITSKEVIINEIEQWLKNFRKNSNEFRLILYVNPFLVDFLTNGTISILSKLMIKYFVRIKLQQNETLHIEQFKFFSVRKNKDITNEYL